MTNYRSPSFDTKNGLFIVDAHPSWSIYFAKPADGVYGCEDVHTDHRSGKARDRDVRRTADRVERVKTSAATGTDTKAAIPA